MLDAGYVREKLGKAVDLLTFGKGPIHDRLIAAVGEVSALRTWQPEGSHGWIKAEMERISDALTREPARGSEGTIAATVRTLSDDKAVEWAHEIAGLAAKARAEIK